MSNAEKWLRAIVAREHDRDGGPDCPTSADAWKHGKALLAELDRLRTAVANARREALDEVIVMAVSNEQQEQNRYWKEAHRCLIAHANELRDASQPAAETQTPKRHENCVVRLSTQSETPTCLYLRDGTKVRIARHSECKGAAWLENVGQDKIETANLQPPARDVEGLRLHIFRRGWNVSKEVCAACLDYFAHLDGGPRT